MKIRAAIFDFNANGQTDAAEVVSWNMYQYCLFIRYDSSTVV